MRAPRLRRLAAPALAAAAILALAGCATDAPQNTFDPAGPVAREQLGLWNIVFPVAVFVFVLVQGLLVVAIFRFRSRRDDDELPKQVAGNTRLEVIWTLIPAGILAALAVPTIGTIFELAARPDDNPLEVRVIGKQYWWEFEYLGEDGQGVVTANELRIPTGRPVYLQMESLSAVAGDEPDAEVGVKQGAVAGGVIHSFWVPRLAGKQDVVPGHVRELTIQADEPGTYEGQCAEFCGLSHARMRMYVIAQDPEQFEQWLAAQAEPAAIGDEELIAQGAEIFASNQCIACHAIDGFQTADGVEAAARVGPDLTHFASRERFAGAILENNTENLRRWLENPPELKAGAQMPANLVADDEYDAIIAFLQSLE